MKNGNVVESANTVKVNFNKVLYTSKVHTTGGREGTAKSDDGRLIVNLSEPDSFGNGTNPEQLFAAGWSACFISSIKRNASGLQIQLPQDISIYAEIDLERGAGGFCIHVRLNVNLPGLRFEEAKAVVIAAHETCPYSKATRNNINIEINVVI